MRTHQTQRTKTTCKVTQRMPTSIHCIVQHVTYFVLCETVCVCDNVSRMRVFCLKFGVNVCVTVIVSDV